MTADQSGVDDGQLTVDLAVTWGGGGLGDSDEVVSGTDGSDSGENGRGWARRKWVHSMSGASP